MNNGKYSKRRGVSTKAVSLILAIVLIIGVSVGATLAWLTAESKSVTNTFVAGEIGSLELTETDSDKQYVIVPGVAITKDPTVTYTPATDVEKNVDAYLFVKVEGGNWTLEEGKYVIKNAANKVVMDWTVDSAWTALNGADNVYYMVVADETVTKDIISNDTINVSSEITKNDITTIAENATNLKFTVYGIQKDGHADVNAAWTAVSTAN